MTFKYSTALAALAALALGCNMMDRKDDNKHSDQKMATTQPAEARAWAIPTPMPRPAPVIRATLPSRRRLGASMGKSIRMRGRTV